GRPFERAAVPRIPRLVAKRLALADAYDDLCRLAGGRGRHHEDARRCDEKPWIPHGDIVMLQAPRHAEKPDAVKRNEHHVEPDERKPERRLSPALMQAKTKCLRKPVGEA